MLNLLNIDKRNDTFKHKGEILCFKKTISYIWTIEFYKKSLFFEGITTFKILNLKTTGNHKNRWAVISYSSIIDMIYAYNINCQSA